MLFVRKKVGNVFLPINITDPTIAANKLRIEELKGLSVTSNKTCFLLNFCVNTYGNNKELPAGYDTYVIGLWAEVFDENWFNRVYSEMPDARFVIISDMDRLGELENKERVHYVRMLHWNYFTRHCQSGPIDWSLKNCKLSSLSYFVTEFRFFITAKLLDTNDTMFSWHNKFRSLSPVNYIFENTGYENRDRLLSLRDRLEDVYELDNFVNDPEYNFNTGDVYKQSMVNCTNETKDVSWVEGFGSSPGPYLTEKTWNPIIHGTAIIPAGQYGTISTLESAGLRFNYGWDNSYDDIPGDLERLEKILITIQTILDMPKDTLMNNVKDSCEYNRDAILSGRLHRYIHNVNQCGLEKLKELL